jgi:hypothetical protein
MGSSTEEFLEGNIMDFEIRVNKFSKSAEIQLNESIADHKSGVKYGISEYFKIIDRNKAIVTGIEGWELIISETWLPVVLNGFDDAGGTVKQPTPVIWREIFLTTKAWSGKSLCTLTRPLMNKLRQISSIY